MYYALDTCTAHSIEYKFIFSYMCFLLLLFCSNEAVESVNSRS